MNLFLQGPRRTGLTAHGELRKTRGRKKRKQHKKEALRNESGRQGEGRQRNGDDDRAREEEARTEFQVVFVAPLSHLTSTVAALEYLQACQTALRAIGTH